jgi:hypothetical protein
MRQREFILNKVAREGKTSEDDVKEAMKEFYGWIKPELPTIEKDHPPSPDAYQLRPVYVFNPFTDPRLKHLFPSGKPKCPHCHNTLTCQYNSFGPRDVLGEETDYYVMGVRLHCPVHGNSMYSTQYKFLKSLPDLVKNEIPLAVVGERHDKYKLVRSSVSL